MAEKFNVTSPEEPLRIPEFETVPEFLLAKAKEHADNGKSYFAIDAVSQEKRYFHKFDEETRKIASAMYKLGLRKSGYVIYMPSEMAKLHIFLTGVWRANGICRASYPDDDSATLEFRIRETKCGIILCDANRISTCKEAIKNIDWNVEIITTAKCDGYMSLDDILENDDGQSCPKLETKADDPAIIFCTSGTTGSPKGAVLTHKNVIYQAYYISLLPFTEDKPNLMFSSATHMSGTLFTLALLMSGKTSIITGKITKEILMETVANLKPGIAFAFATYLLQLVSPEAKAKGYDFSSLEYMLTGGAIITPATKKALMQLPNMKDLIIPYGLTEVGMVVVNVKLQPKDGCTPFYQNLPDFSVGRPCPGISIQVRDVETLELLGPNKKGEICIKFPGGHFDSYLNNPEATKDAFLDGHMRSGDIGYYDEQGFIYVVDRLKEIFKYYNNHISPSEVENVIAQHPIVDEVCVVGVPDPGGDVPRAFITVKEKPKEMADLIEEIKQFAHDRLPSYKHLRGGLYVIPELPKGKSGKVTRALVAKIKV